MLEKHVDGGDGQTTGQTSGCDRDPSAKNDAHKPSASIEPSAVVDTESEYMEGWRLYMLTAGIWIATFLSTLETTVVSTSLVSIADTLSGFDERNWVVTAYFLLILVWCFELTLSTPPNPNSIEGLFESKLTASCYGIERSTAFLVIYAKLASIFGSKTMFLLP